MSEPVDLYQLLGVRPDAEPCTIRAAYRRLAWRCHPDVGGSQRAMAALNGAWRTLRDPDARARYDDRRSGVKGCAFAPQAARPPQAPAPPQARVEEWPPAAAARADDPDGGGAAARATTQRPPPSGRDDGSTVLDFGRYEGWSLIQVSAVDPDYLEWLTRTSIGRRLQPEIAALLATRRVAAAARRDATYRPARPASRWGRARPSAAR